MSDREVMPQRDSAGYGHIIKDVTAHTKELIQGEMEVFKNEMKTVLPRVAKHSRDTVIFGAMCALSVFPLLAFLVIGLGTILGGNFWLSSLIVFVVFAAIGAPIAMRSLKKIKEEDFSFNRTKGGLVRGVQAVQEKVKDVVDAAKGNPTIKGANHEYRH